MNTQPAQTQRLSFARSADLQRRLHELVPGGAHTYARGSDQYPEEMAPVLVRGAGARVSTSTEIGLSSTAWECVRSLSDTATSRWWKRWPRPTRGRCEFQPSDGVELLAAEMFLEQVPGADMVKFAKNGSDVTTAAVKLARAATGRQMVGICRTQPFFSTDDWFIGSTPMAAGIPSEAMLTTDFAFNDLDSVREMLESSPRPGRVRHPRGRHRACRTPARFPSGHPRPCRPDGFVTDPGRDDHRYAMGRRRRPGGVRRHPGPFHAGEKLSAMGSRFPH